MYATTQHLESFADFLVKQAQKFLDDKWNTHITKRKVEGIYPRNRLEIRENPGLRKHCKALQRFLNIIEQGCDEAGMEYIEKAISSGRFKFGYHASAVMNYSNIMDSGLDPFRRKSQTHGSGEYLGVYPYDAHWYGKQSYHMMVVMFISEFSNVANAEAAYVVRNPLSHNSTYCLPIVLLKYCTKSETTHVDLRTYGAEPEPLQISAGPWLKLWKARTALIGWKPSLTKSEELTNDSKSMEVEVKDAQVEEGTSEEPVIAALAADVAGLTVSTAERETPALTVFSPLSVTSTSVSSSSAAAATTLPMSPSSEVRRSSSSSGTPLYPDFASPLTSSASVGARSPMDNIATVSDLDSSSSSESEDGSESNDDSKHPSPLSKNQAQPSRMQSLLRFFSRRGGRKGRT